MTIRVIRSTVTVTAEAADGSGVAYKPGAKYAGKASLKLYAQWKEDPTEENFAAMASEYSEDTASTSNGGLYEKVVKYSMVPGVNDFLFAPGRTAGDTDVVFGQSEGYTGYHVMYFVGENTRNCDLLAEDAKRDEDFSAASAEITAGYEAKEGSTINLVALD